jgi:hypothetical protein
MICPPCCKGGDITAKIKSGTVVPALGKVAAEEHHKQCRGGTWCDCQCNVDAALSGARRALVAVA